MKTKSNIKKTWLGTLFVVVLVAAAMSVTVFAGDAEAAEHTSKMYATAWSGASAGCNHSGTDFKGGLINFVHRYRGRRSVLCVLQPQADLSDDFL